jgi:hypothetical protein
MKKFVLKILLFFLLFLVLNLIYLFVIQRFDWNFKKVLEARNLENKNYETLILGNSLAMDGINTEMLGNAYNLSIGGATLATNERQLSQYLQDAKVKPRTVILGMARCIDEDYSRQTIHPLIRYLDGNKFDSFYDLPMIQFKWMAKVLIKRLLSEPHRNAEIVEGQLRIGRSMPDRSAYVDNPETLLDTSWYRNLQSISQIAELCKQNDIDLLVFEMPGVKKTQNDIPIGPYQIDEYLLYNFNNKDFCQIFQEDKHWLGGSHLNSAGAEVFTEALKTLIGI